MPERFVPFYRHFSAIGGLQKEYTLIYSLDAGAGGSRLTLCRTGEQPQADSIYLPCTPKRGYELLTYLYENAVQPEIWRDVVENAYPLLEQT